jgi:hypothetical protein
VGIRGNRKRQRRDQDRKAQIGNRDPRALRPISAMRTTGGTLPTAYLEKSKALNTHAGWENKKTGPGIFCRKEAQKSIGK